MPTIEQARAWSPRTIPCTASITYWRVLRMAERLAEEVGADREIVRAAALLHDAAGAHPESGDARLDHEHESAGVARRVLTDEGWPEGTHSGRGTLHPRPSLPRARPRRRRWRRRCSSTPTNWT